MQPVVNSLLKFVVPAIAATIIVVRFRKSPLLAATFVWPSLRQSLPWIGLYIGWLLASDFVLGWRGPWDFAPWREAPLASSVLRVLAVVVAGPILEEIVFRGLAFGALARTRAGPIAAIVITSIFWSLLHLEYSAPVITVIALEGLILGAARWRTGSLYLPIALHMTWNLYAIW